MLFLFMFVFLCTANIFGMQNQLDAIDQDYGALVPYVVRMLQVTKDDITPFELLRSLTRSDALINSSIKCSYMSPTEHIELIIKKHKIRIAHDWDKQKVHFGNSKALFHRWFVGYFQSEIVPRMIQELKKEREETEQREQHSSSGV